MKKPLLILILTFVFWLTACSASGELFKEGIVEFIANEYFIYDTVNSATDSDNFSEIYLAENQTIDEVSANIVSHQQPNEMSEIKDGKQVLIYGNLFVILTEDEENPSNIFIEVANDQFVRDNYSPDFFDGLLVLWVLDELLDVDDWGKKRNLQCKQYPDTCYAGYEDTSSSGGGFKGYHSTPTIRDGSSSVRGGGPGTGK